MRSPDEDTTVDRVADEHFEARYRADGDPWRLEHRWYERRKRALTMAALPRERYHRAFEPACGAGLLSELGYYLAPSALPLLRDTAMASCS